MSVPGEQTEMEITSGTVPPPPLSAEFRKLNQGVVAMKMSNN